jgi:hypothetical protein
MMTSSARRTIATIALGAVAFAGQPGGSSVAAQQPDPAQWMGPFFTNWHCQVVLALRGDDGPCQFNPSPPTTSWGWWYKLGTGAAR